MTQGITDGHYMRFYDNGISLGHAVNCSISVSMSPREIASKDIEAGWTDQAPGQKTATWSTDGLYAEDDNAAAALFQKLNDGTALDLILTTDTTGDRGWVGVGYITSLEISAPNNESVTWSASGTFSGPLVMVTIS